jgi:hypothetical protein
MPTRWVTIESVLILPVIDASILPRTNRRYRDEDRSQDIERHDGIVMPFQSPATKP